MKEQRTDSKDIDLAEDKNNETSNVAKIYKYENLEKINTINPIRSPRLMKRACGTQWIGDGNLLIHGRVDENEWTQSGLACLIPKNKVNKIRNWEYINHRTLKVIIQMSKGNMEH